jgi:hypothetical protein
MRSFELIVSPYACPDESNYDSDNDPRVDRFINEAAFTSIFVNAESAKTIADTFLSAIDKEAIVLNQKFFDGFLNEQIVVCQNGGLYFYSDVPGTKDKVSLDSITGAKDLCLACEIQDDFPDFCYSQYFLVESVKAANKISEKILNEEGDVFNENHNFGWRGANDKLYADNAKFPSGFSGLRYLRKVKLFK